MTLKTLWPFGKKGISAGGTGWSGDVGDAFTRSTLMINPMGQGAAVLGGVSWNNSAVMACMAYLVRTMPEAKLRVYVTKGDEDVAQPEHPLYDLLRKPNVSAGYMWSDVISSIGVSLSLDGNGYLRARRNGYSQIESLEYVPFSSCEPRTAWRGGPLSHYRLYNGFSYEDVPIEDIVHFRFGIDEENTLKGMSPFKSVVRECMADNEAAVYNHAILRNLGVLGFLVTPKAGAEFSQEQARTLENRIVTQFTGEDRGKPAVLSLEASVQTIGNSPDKMQVREIRRTPEERISAVFGIPAIVAGLGAGLERSTFANFKEAREAAMESCNAPLWSRIAETLDQFFAANLMIKAGQFVRFDLSGVRALQEDEDKRHARAQNNYQKGIWMRSESRTYTGKQATTEDDLYYTDIQSERLAATSLAQAANESNARAKVLKALDAMAE